LNFTFKKVAPIIYVDVNSKVDLEKYGANKVDIILSPSFYWVKEQVLPVKYLREVKPLLPSIFEDSVPEGSYSYTAFKSKTKENSFVLVAYSDKFILDTLSEIGIKSSQIRHIYLAQNEFDKLEGNYKVDDEHIVVVKDGIVAQLPALLLPTSEELNLQDLKLSKSKIELVKFAHIIDPKSIFKLSIFLFILVLIVAAEYGMRSYEVKKLEAKKEEIFEKKHLKSTMFQNEALANKLKKRFKKQTKLRNYIENITKIPLANGELIKYLEVKSKKILFHIDIADSSEMTKIEKYLQSKKMKFTTKMKKSTLKVEVEL